MKKLLVVALILSAATLANAALTLTMTGPTQLNVGEAGTYTVSYSGAYVTGIDVDIISTLGTIGGGNIITTNRDTALDWTAPNSVSGNYEITIMDDVDLRDLGIPTFSFQLTSASAGLATISFIENSFMDAQFQPYELGTTVLPTLDVTITPEPATIGLLIGGAIMAIRRNRKSL